MPAIEHTAPPAGKDGERFCRFRLTRRGFVHQMEGRDTHVVLYDLNARHGGLVDGQLSEIAVGEHVRLVQSFPDGV